MTATTDPDDEADAKPDHYVKVPHQVVLGVGEGAQDRSKSVRVRRR